MNAGEAMGRVSPPGGPELVKLLGCSESDALPPESFLDEDLDDEAGDVEAGLEDEPWVPAMLVDSFPNWWEAGSPFVATARLFSAVDIVWGFAAGGIEGALFELP